MGKFAKWYNYAMELYRLDPEIYPLLLVGFTSMSWGGVLLMRKAGQVRLENQTSSIDIHKHIKD
jgi:hypothetical protein